MPAPTVQRQKTPLFAGERPMLDAWLDFHRATLLMKCQGLTDEQLRLRSAPPSTLSLLGLVRHMTEVERSWFRRRVAGESLSSAPRLYSTPEHPDADFDDLESLNVTDTFAAYTAELDHCRRAVAGISLDTAVGERSVRWVYLHILEEYARHNGHADLLRERIDGATGA